MDITIKFGSGRCDYDQPGAFKSSRSLGHFMAMKPTHSLKQNIHWADIRDHDIGVQIQALLDCLSCNTNLSPHGSASPECRFKRQIQGLTVAARVTRMMRGDCQRRLEIVLNLAV
jgi:hypothetical protein